MSIVLTELSRLGRVAVLKEAAAAEAKRHPSRDMTPIHTTVVRGLGPQENFIQSAKFRIMLLLIVFMSLLALTVSFLIDEWDGVVYAFIGIALFIVLPLIIIRIIMISRARTKHSLKLKKEQLNMSIATLNLDIPAKLAIGSNKNLDKILAQCAEFKKNSTNEMKIQKSSICTLNSVNEKLDKERLTSKRSSNSSTNSGSNQSNRGITFAAEAEVKKYDLHKTAT